jgi:hypothetical protein
VARPGAGSRRARRRGQIAAAFALEAAERHRLQPGAGGCVPLRLRGVGVLALALEQAGLPGECADELFQSPPRPVGQSARLAFLDQREQFLALLLAEPGGVESGADQFGVSEQEAYRGRRSVRRSASGTSASRPTPTRTSSRTRQSLTSPRCSPRTCHPCHGCHPVHTRVIPGADEKCRFAGMFESFTAHWVLKSRTSGRVERQDVLAAPLLRVGLAVRGAL